MVLSLCNRVHSTKHGNIGFHLEAAKAVKNLIGEKDETSVKKDSNDDLDSLRPSA